MGVFQNFPAAHERAELFLLLPQQWLMANNKTHKPTLRPPCPSRLPVMPRFREEALIINPFFLVILPIMPKKTDIDKLNPRDFIIIKNARVNNLKNLSVAIPRNKLVVITGLSGSGKSSLAFNTLFAEGQRMYVESLSSYSRQFLGRMEKPDVDYIRGVSPAIAIEQKVSTRNPRSTVGTSTEIYDYLKLLFARIGKTISPVSGEEVHRDTVTSAVDFLQKEKGVKITVAAPLRVQKGRKLQDELALLLSKGFSRVLFCGEVHFIEDALHLPKKKEKDWEILITRVVSNAEDEDLTFQLSDAVQTAFFEGHGDCIVYAEKEEKRRYAFSDRFERDGLVFTEPSTNFFSFNNPFGACKRCEGLGRVLGYDEDLIMPDKNLSVFNGGIAPWRGDKTSEWLRPLLLHASKFQFPIHRPVHQLTAKERELLWTGNEHFQGLRAFFAYLEKQSYKIQYRVMMSRYRGQTGCPECRGTKLRSDAGYVKIAGTSIIDVVLMPVEEALAFFEKIKLTDYELKVAGRIISEIKSRLNYLVTVGLGYLTLNRVTGTLSGGEYQRIKLATGMGSALVGSMYILDEPSIGLHPRDTVKMTEALYVLRDLGNTVIVVEHEEEIMRAADQIIDIGPGAGVHGGELIFQGHIGDINKAEHKTHTINFLSGYEKIPLPKRRRWNSALEITGARENNLKNITVKIPLHVLTAVSGVSGSGKSTLIQKILYPALLRHLGFGADSPGKFDTLGGDLPLISGVEFVNQHPIGKSSRSNPISYVKAYDAIRTLFADQPLARQRHYQSGHFSFNTEGGRCETCQGEGEIRVEMQFMADIRLVCESCRGKRFKASLLEVTYEGKNIADILDMTVEEGLAFFKSRTGIYNHILSLYDVGLGYIKLGQSSNSLSGGEAQRVKLASFMGKKSGSAKEHILFIFDEPTTGLHFHDIAQLLKAINALVNEGHSALIIEHNLEVIKSADWVIDLGPEGGEKNGGQVVAQGTPEEIVEKGEGYTAKYLKEKLANG